MPSSGCPSRSPSSGAASASRIATPATAETTGRAATPRAQRSGSPRRGAVGAAARSQLALAARQHAAAGHSQQRGHDGHGGDGGRGDDDAGAETHAADERDPDGHQAADRHDDDRAGGQHRHAGGRVRGAGSGRRIIAGGQSLAVSGDEEQRVVDAGAEAEHHADGRGDGRDVHPGAGQREQRQTADEPEARGHERERHRHDRAEQQRQQQQRDRDTDQLADRRHRVVADVDDLAAHRDLGAGLLSRADRALEAIPCRRPEVFGPAVVLHGRERDLAVRRDLQVAHAAHVWLSGDGFQRLLDAGAGDRGTITGEHDLGVAARHLREALLEQLLGTRRVDARRAVVVDEAGAERAAERRDAGDDDDRDEDGAAPVAGCAGAEAGEEGGHGVWGGLRGEVVCLRYRQKTTLAAILQLSQSCTERKWLSFPAK